MLTLLPPLLIVNLITYTDDRGVGSHDYLSILLRILCRQTSFNICYISTKRLNDEIDKCFYSKTDVICISDNWFNYNSSDIVNEVNGYHLYRFEKFSNSIGVAIYVTSHIQCRLVCTSFRNNTNTSNIEYIFLEIVNFGRKLLLILCKGLVRPWTMDH